MFSKVESWSQGKVNSRKGPLGRLLWELLFREVASLYLIQTPKKWPLKENTEGQLESERQWGIPTDARAEGTVPWVSLLCDLGPTLFIFSVTLRSLCGCSLSVGLRCFASRVGFCCVSCSAGDHSVHCCYLAGWLHAVSFRLAAVSFLLASLFSERQGLF